MAEYGTHLQDVLMRHYVSIRDCEDADSMFAWVDVYVTNGRLQITYESIMTVLMAK